MADNKKPVTPGVGSAYVANQAGNVGKGVDIGAVGNLQTKEDSGAVKPGDEPEANPVIDSEEAPPQENLPETDNVALLQSPFWTEAERKSVESALQPIKFDDLIFKGFIEQDVQIRPTLKVTFRSINGGTSAALEQNLHELKGTDRYVLHMFYAMHLCAMVSAINGKPMPPFEDENGGFDSVKFDARLKQFLQMSSVVIDLMMAHGKWFEDRVTKACTLDALKN